MVGPMRELQRIGLFTQDAQLDNRFDFAHKAFVRANIELIQLSAHSNPGDLDLIIALGGDGTVLRALATHPGTPVLAVNFGHLGFLTASDRKELDKVVVRLLNDDYFVEERLTLHVQHGRRTHRCVNEVVIKGTSHMIQVSITVDGQMVREVRGDGIIVGTPTGSTGYLLSTGAPIVMPQVDCIMINSLNEYSFSSRPLVLPGNARITLRIEPESLRSEVLLVPDGAQRSSVRAGDAVEIQSSDVPARLVFFDRGYFFRNLKGRLQWGVARRRGRSAR